VARTTRSSSSSSSSKSKRSAAQAIATSKEKESPCETLHTRRYDDHMIGMGTHVMEERSSDGSEVNGSTRCILQPPMPVPRSLMRHRVVMAYKYMNNSVYKNTNNWARLRLSGLKAAGAGTCKE
jgi:predicted membrane chloride channel (bestrophin family)